MFYLDLGILLIEIHVKNKEKDKLSLCAKSKNNYWVYVGTFKNTKVSLLV